MGLHFWGVKAAPPVPEGEAKTETTGAGCPREGFPMENRDKIRGKPPAQSCGINSSEPFGVAQD